MTDGQHAIPPELQDGARRQRRRVRWMGALLTLLLGVLSWGTARLVATDRQALRREFAEDRLAHLTEVTGEVEKDLEEISHDLDFIANLLRKRPAVASHRQTLAALLTTIKAYRSVAIFDRQSELLVSENSDNTVVIAPDVLAAMKALAQEVQVHADDRLLISVPIREAGGWLRIFVQQFTAEAGVALGSIAFLVDMGPLLSKLRILGSDPHTRVLALGPQEDPVVISDPDLVRLFAHPAAKSPTSLSSLIERGRPGMLLLSAEEAGPLGLEPVAYVVAYSPLRMESAQWTVLTVTSLATIEGHEHRLILRVGAATGCIALLVLAFGAYFFAVTKKQAVMAERLLRADAVGRLNEKANKILDTIPTGVMVFSEDQRIIVMNRALRERSADRRRGSSLDEVFAGASTASRAAVANLLRETTAADAPKSLLGARLDLFAAQGQYNLHAIPLAPAAEPDRVLLVIEDLTEVRALESQLLRAEKLATVGILAAGIAHEIGTPLGVIRGRAEYIMGKVGEDHEQAAGLRTIIEQIDRIARTIRSLLDFSRVKPIAAPSTPLAPIVGTVIELLRYEADRHKARLEAQVSEGLPPIAADADQLQQVLVNLIMNACDACKSGGLVRVTASELDRGPAKPGPRLRIEVSDNGAGIATEQIHRIFDPFYTTKKRGQGTGLGLTIVQQIVRSHGGTIEVNSKLGEGTSVVILWPLASSDTSVPEVQRAV